MKKENVAIKNSYEPKDNDEECPVHWKSDNIEIMIHDKPDEAIEDFLNHLLIAIKLNWKQERSWFYFWLFSFIVY